MSGALDVGSMEFRLMAGIAQLQKDMDAAKSLIGNAMGNIQSTIDSTMKAIGGLTAALGIAASVNAFGEMIKGAIEAQAQLAKLSQVTGASIESLSALKSVAKLSGTDIDTVAVGIEKLAKSMVSAQDGSGKSALAFRALGISSKEVAANLNDPGKMMLVVAQHLDKFASDGAKTTLMMELFGKAGANLLPMMKDLAEKGALNATTTTEQAKAAEEFMRTLAQWQNQWKEFFAVIATAVTPALNDLFKSMLAGGSVAKTFTEYVKQLAASGQLRQWAQDAAEAIIKLKNAIVPAIEIAAAYFAIFVAGPPVVAAVSGAMVTLTTAVDTYLVSLVAGTAVQTGWNRTLFGMSVEAELAAGSLTKMQVAAGVLFAAFAGWQIGSYLSENFVEARVAGLAFVGVMVAGWATLKYEGQLMWTVIKYEFETAVNLMKAGWGGFISVVATGLEKAGFSEASASAQKFADSLMKPLATQKSLADQTGALTTAYKANLSAIHTEIDGLATFEILADKTVKTVGKLKEESNKPPVKIIDAESLKAFESAFDSLGKEIAKLEQASVSLENYKDASEHARRAEIDFQTTLGNLKKISEAQKNQLKELADEFDNLTNKNKLLTESMKMRTDGIKAEQDATLIIQGGVQAVNAYTQALADQTAGKLKYLTANDKMVYGVGAVNDAIHAANQAVAEQTYIMNAAIKTIGDADKAASSMADSSKNSAVSLLADMVAMQKDADAAKYNAEQKTRLQLANSYATQSFKDAAIAAARYADSIAKISDASKLGIDLEEKIKAINAEMILDDKARAEAQLQIEVDKWQKIIDLAEKAYQTEKEKGDQADQEKLASMRAGLDRSEQALVDYVNKVHEKVNFDEFKALWSGVDTAAKGFFDSLVAGGSDAWMKLRDSLKSTLIDFLYQMTVKKWIFQIGAEVSGTGASGMTSGGGGLIGTASNAYSAYNSAGGGNSILGGLNNNSLYNSQNTGYLNQAGLMTGENVLAGQTVGATASAALGSSAFAGTAGAELASGAGLGVGAGVATEAGVGAVAEGVLAAIPVVGWIGLAVLAAWSLFGGDDGPQQKTTYTLGSSANPNTGSVDTGRNQSGGNYVGGQGVNTAFGSVGITDVFWTETQQQNAQKTADFLAGMKASDDAINKYLSASEHKNVVDALNNKSITVQTGVEGTDPTTTYGTVFAQRLQTILEAIQPGMSKLIDGFTGNAAQLETEVESLLTARAHLADYSKVIGETVTLEDMVALKKDGESASQTITRLANTFQITDAAVKLMGGDVSKAFGTIGLASDGVREAMVKNAGGLDKFAAQTNAYYANFFTDEKHRSDIVGQASASLNETFSKLGVAVPTTHEDFTKLLNSFDLTTESGRSAYQSVMDASGAFVTIHGTAQEASAAFNSMGDSIRASIAKLNGTPETNTDLGKLAGMNKDWGSISNLMTITDTDREHMSDEVQKLITGALKFAADHMTQSGSSSGPLNVYQGVIGDGSSTATEATAAALPTHALEIELLKLQGKALEALNLQRQDETQSLSDSDKALKLQIYTLQDQQAMQALQVQLLNAEGKAYEATIEQRKAALALLVPEQAAIQQQIYAAQDQAKTDALQVQIATLLGDSNAALNATRAKELAALGPTDRALQEQIFKLQDQAKAAKDATTAMATLTKQMDAVANLKSSIAGSIDSIRGPNTGAALAAAQSALTGVMGGSIDDRLKAAGTLQNAIMAHYQEQMSAAQTLQQTHDAADQAAIAAANQLNAAYRKLGDYAQSLLVGNMSALSPEEKLAAARSQYETTLAGARAHDPKSVDALQGVTQTYLDLKRGYDASSGEYVKTFTDVQSALAQLGSMAGPDQVFQQNSIALQTQLGSIQTDALAQLTDLSNLTDQWQAELQDHLTEQAIAFTEIGLTSAQIAQNTDGLDIRIGAAVAAAIAAHTEAVIAAVEFNTKATVEVAELQANMNVTAVEDQTKALKPAPAVMERN